MNCKTCGAEMSSEMKFCPVCGQTNEVLCPNCGKAIEEDQRFCTECGTSIDDVPSRKAKKTVVLVPQKHVDTEEMQAARSLKGKGLAAMISGIASIYLPFIGYSLVGIIAGISGRVLSREPVKCSNTTTGTLAKIGKITSICGIAYSVWVAFVAFMAFVAYIIFVLLYLCFVFAMLMPGMYY